MSIDSNHVSSESCNGKILMTGEYRALQLNVCHYIVNQPSQVVATSKLHLRMAFRFFHLMILIISTKSNYHSPPAVAILTEIIEK